VDGADALDAFRHPYARTSGVATGGSDRGVHGSRSNNTGHRLNPGGRSRPLTARPKGRHCPWPASSE
jgi:hypothetical protein